MLRRTAPGLLLVLVACLPEPHEVVGKACDELHPCPDALVCYLGTCQPSSNLVEDGGREGGIPDAGRPDAGGADGGRADGGEVDAGSPDAGDADGGSTDAGRPDAGGGDGGVPDGGESCPNLLANGGFESGLGGYVASGSPRPAMLAWESAVVRTGQRSVLVLNNGGTTSSDFFGVRIDKDAIGPVDAGLTYCLSAWVQRGQVRVNQLRVVARQYTTSGGESDTGTITYTVPDDAWSRFVHQTRVDQANVDRVSFRFSADPLPDAGGYFYVDDVRVWPDPSGQCDAGGC